MKRETCNFVHSFPLKAGQCFLMEYKKCIAKYSLKIKVNVWLPGLVLQKGRVVPHHGKKKIHFPINKKRKYTIALRISSDVKGNIEPSSVNNSCMFAITFFEQMCLLSVF